MLFNGRDADDHDMLTIYHDDTPTAPNGFKVDEGKKWSAVSETRTDSAVPAASTNSTVLWYRVIRTNSSLTVKAATSEAGLSSASDCYSSTAFAIGGGSMGLYSSSGLQSTILQHLTVKSDRDDNGSWETEHEERITISSGMTEETFIHDAAGNLT